MSSYMRTTYTIGPGGRTTRTTYSNNAGGGIDFGSDLKKPSRYSVGWNKSRYEPRQPVIKTKSPAKKYSGKTYEELKAECLADGSLFEDPDFDAVDSNIFFSQSPPKAFEWLRPSEIAERCGEKPEFIVEGASRFDVKQGELGDCWLLAAVASLSQYPKLMENVIPPGQGFSDGYAGIFRFNFWVFGQWREVVIDDRLPTYNGRLVFLHSVTSNEFWSSLLEKAYAKLVGSYEALKGGSTSEAFEDFTGGVAEMFDLGPKADPNLLKIMLKAQERQSLMGCSIDGSPDQFEARLTNGLVVGHAYSITAVKMVDIKTSTKEGKIPLVRMRNPWGNETEWKGRWSDQSPEWQLIPDDEKKEVGLVFEKDGEFWMSYQDFVTNFTKLELCYLSPDCLEEEGESARKKWEMTMMDGSWKKRITAGGCRNYIETFWINPQYRFEVVDPDDDDEDDTGTVIVALMQKERRKKRAEGADLLTVGYLIYTLKDPNCKPLDLNFFKSNAATARAPKFINLREICGRHKLPKGHYCLVPSTFEPGEESDFIVRLFSEKATPSEEIDDTTAMSDVQPTITPSAEDDESTKSLKEAFKKIAGVDMEIDAYELQEILNIVFMKEFTFDGFSADTCRSLVATKDLDKSGKLGFQEFKTLWNQIRIWKTAFKNQDVDKSGNFNSFELRRTLNEIGFSVSNQTFNALVQRYSHKDGKIYFDDYIHLVARLSTMFEIFKEMSDGGTQAKFTMDAFIQTTMYT